jgi:hypothetical protein
LKENQLRQTLAIDAILFRFGIVSSGCFGARGRSPLSNSGAVPM